MFTKIARFNLGLLVGRAVYKNREAHLESVRKLRGLTESGKLSGSEKAIVVKHMVVNLGKDTAELWAPATGLWAFKKFSKIQKAR